MLFAGSMPGRLAGQPLSTVTERQASKAEMQAASDAYIDHLAREINLTSEQRRQLQPIIASEFQSINDLRGQSLSRSEMDARLKQVRLSALMQIMVILTDEQWDQFTRLEE